MSPPAREQGAGSTDEGSVESRETARPSVPGPWLLCAPYPTGTNVSGKGKIHLVANFWQRGRAVPAIVPLSLPVGTGRVTGALRPCATPVSPSFRGQGVNRMAARLFPDIVSGI